MASVHPMMVRLVLPLLLATCVLPRAAVQPVAGLNKVLVFRDHEELKGEDAKELPPGAELLLVQAVFRHGARTPLTSRYQDRNLTWSMCNYSKEGVHIRVRSPNNLPDHSSAFASKILQPHRPPCGIGELTDVGYAQALKFGAWLRQRYIEQYKLLQPGPQGAERVASHSTHVPRAIATLQGVLTGLFRPPDGASPSNITMSVVATPEHHQILYANAQKCRYLAALIRKADQETHNYGSEVESENQREVAQSIRFFVKLPQHDARSWISWKRLLDAAMCHEVHNITNFDGLTPLAYRTIDHEATRRIVHVLGPPCNGTGACKNLLRLGIGLLLHQLMQRMIETAKCGLKCETPRMYLYSGHDSTLMPIMSVLGHPMSEWPPFMSNLIFELWRVAKGKHVVRVLYNFQPLQLPHKTGVHPTLQEMDKSIIGPYEVSEADYRRACDRKLNATAPGDGEDEGAEDDDGVAGTMGRVSSGGADGSGGSGIGDGGVRTGALAGSTGGAIQADSSSSSGHRLLQLARADSAGQRQRRRRHRARHR